MPDLRVPPYSKEAESSVLGSLLIDKHAIIAVAEILLPEDFYETAHRLIFEACLSLYEERSPIDILTVSDKLKRKRRLKKQEVLLI